MKIFDILPNGEMFITKVSRPISFWLVLLIFLILLILNSFGLIKTDPQYLDILKQILLIMIGFYFTARTIEKFAQVKYNNYNNNYNNNYSNGYNNNYNSYNNQSNSISSMNSMSVSEPSNTTTTTTTTTSQNKQNSSQMKISLNDIE